MRNRKSRKLGLETLEPRLALATFFVATTGSDAANGSSATPWLTLQNAANRVNAGDTVIVRAGNYAGFDLSTDGTAANPITFRGEAGAVVNAPNARTADGINLEGADYIVIEGFKVTGVTRAGIRSVLNHHVTIRNNNADLNGRWGIFTGFSDDLLIENNIGSRSGQEHGIYVSNSGDRPVIRGNQLWGNRANGIHMNGDVSQGGDGIISNALVERNIIYDNGLGGGSGINADGVQNSRFQNNLLYNNHASGISLYRIDGAQGSNNNVVVNNTIVQASDGRWAVNIRDGSIGNTVYNNILYNNHSFRGSISVSADSLPGFSSNYNIVMSRFTTNDGGTVLTLAQWQSATGQDLNSIIATPAALFVNVAANDYHLSGSSPARNAGTSALAPTIDLEGRPRPSGPAWDIGAYEFAESSNNRFVIVAPDAGLNLPVRAFDPLTNSDKFTPIYPYGTAFSGGVRVAAADVNGDGTPDVITAPGPGMEPRIKVFDGNTGVQLPGTVGSLLAYTVGMTAGVFVAAADLNGDGKADLIVAPDRGGGPHVRTIDGATGASLGEFFAYEPAFSGGVRVATADIDGNGTRDIVTSPGFGLEPRVKVFNRNGTSISGNLNASFLAYAAPFTGGVYVATGDVNGDGRADIITGPGYDGGPHISVFSGVDNNKFKQFFVYAPAFTGGIRVGSLDFNADGFADIITGAGFDGGPHVRIFDGAAPSSNFGTVLAERFGYSEPFLGGIFVAGLPAAVAPGPVPTSLPAESSPHAPREESGVALDSNVGMRGPKPTLRENTDTTALAQLDSLFATLEDDDAGLTNLE